MTTFTFGILSILSEFSLLQKMLRSSPPKTDIRAIVEPYTQADPELKSERRYSNLSSAEVLDALRTREHYATSRSQSERTLRDILNRMNYRLKRSGFKRASR